MVPLAVRLASAGFKPRRLTYSGRRSLDAALERLASERAAPHFVGHSLGGVLIFDMLARHPEVAAGGIVHSVGSQGAAASTPPLPAPAALQAPLDLPAVRGCSR